MLNGKIIIIEKSIYLVFASRINFLVGENLIDIHYYQARKVLFLLNLVIMVLTGILCSIEIFKNRVVR